MDNIIYEFHNSEKTYVHMREKTYFESFSAVCFRNHQAFLGIDLGFQPVPTCCVFANIPPIESNRRTEMFENDDFEKMNFGLMYALNAKEQYNASAHVLLNTCSNF